jgi:hypothetical protein
MLASVSLWVRGKAPGKGRRGTTRRKSRPGPVVPWACPALCVLALPPSSSLCPGDSKGDRSLFPGKGKVPVQLPSLRTNTQSRESTAPSN